MPTNQRGTPVYRFDWSGSGDDESHTSRPDSTTRDEWGDHSRRTDDEDAFAVEEPHPDAIMALAVLAREDEDCDVSVLGMSN